MYHINSRLRIVAIRQTEIDHTLRRLRSKKSMKAASIRARLRYEYTRLRELNQELLWTKANFISALKILENIKKESDEWNL